VATCLSECAEWRVVGVEVMLVLALASGTLQLFLHSLGTLGPVCCDTMLAETLVASWEISCCVASHIGILESVLAKCLKCMLTTNLSFTLTNNCGIHLGKKLLRETEAPDP